MQSRCCRQQEAARPVTTGGKSHAATVSSTTCPVVAEINSSFYTLTAMKQFKHSFSIIHHISAGRDGIELLAVDLTSGQ